jgi:hypothetical protein
MARVLLKTMILPFLPMVSTPLKPTGRHPSGRRPVFRGEVGAEDPHFGGLRGASCGPSRPAYTGWRLQKMLIF